MLHEICGSKKRLILSNLEPPTISPDIPFWAYTIVSALCRYNIKDCPSIIAVDTDLPDDMGKFSTNWVALSSILCPLWDFSIRPLQMTLVLVF